MDDGGTDIDFGFPFQPYDIQRQFMKRLYEVLETRSIGLFESPTGTGKSLSIICSSLKWLKDHESEPLHLDPDPVQPQSVSSQPPATTDTTEDKEGKKPIETPEWVKEHMRKKEEAKRQIAMEEHMEKLNAQRRHLKRLREIDEKSEGYVIEQRPAKRIKLNPTSASSHTTDKTSKVDQDDDKYLLEDYDSDDEISAKDIRAQLKKTFDISSSSDDEDDNFGSRKRLRPLDDNDEDDDLYVRKIFYCSRTHSQLSQFVSEVQRTRWGKELKLVVLGSRKTLCINPEVRNLPTINQINDKCLDLMKGAAPDSRIHNNPWRPKHYISGSIFTSRPIEDESDEKNKTAKCPYYDQTLQVSLRDYILSKVRDIEDLIALGKSVGTCAYYGSRAAIKSAELVVLPYNMLLHKPTRESLGIDVKNNIVIIDEAHNLIDTINNLYSVEVTAAKLSQAHAQLSQYLQRYDSRLRAKNKVYIQKLLFILSALLKFLSKPTASTSTTSSEMGKHDVSAELMTLNDFLFASEIDNVNMFKIEKFIQRSEIVRKVNGFSTEYSVEVKLNLKEKVQLNVLEDEFEKHRPALGLVESFLMALTNKNVDGRILVTRSSDLKASSIKYILLNPEVYFEDILTQARSVVLAGGTMQPFDDFVLHLVSPRIPQERIKYFSCGHVIPDENIKAVIFDAGASGVEFDFSFENRNNTKMINEVGQLVVNIATVVPDGVVLFFPSYQYEELVLNAWKASGVLARIEQKKKIFREPKHTSSIDSVLQEYADCIERTYPSQNPSSQRGALLSCVVGGKLSEGINFKDGLGRCVIVVGLPYPNAKDPVLIEKLAYAAHKRKTSNTSEFYDTLCMKAVNQSIGRSIRHAADYATIVLVDKRYKRPAIVSKLPGWISKQLVIAKSFGEGFSNIASFFRAKKPNQIELEKQRFMRAQEKLSGGS